MRCGALAGPLMITVCFNMHKAYLQMDRMLDVVKLGHSICQADCIAWEERVPAFHDEQLLGDYHLQAGYAPERSPARSKLCSGTQHWPFTKWSSAASQ